MEKNPSRIPPGEHCYRVYPLREGEVLVDDLARFGRDLREFLYRPGFKQVLCPYWQRTDYGTVRCHFTEKEVLDEEMQSYEEALALLAPRLGSQQKAREFPRGWALPDEIKICGVNQDEDDPCAYDA